MAEKHDLEATPSFTAKNILFCRLILDGHPTVDAHRMAGYKGEPHAAYELRSKLRGLLRAEAEKRGVSFDGVATDLAVLDNLPVAQTTVGVSEKLAIINAKRKLLEAEAPPVKGKDMPRFVIDVEAEPIKEDDKTLTPPAVGGKQLDLF